MRELTYAQAGVEAVAEEMRRDPKTFYMSTDTIAPLLKEFGPQRIKATPIAEGALTGIAIGAAGSGYRPIMDWRQVTFSFVAMDQIVNQAAKIHYMFGGQRTFPVLYRANVGGGTRLAALAGAFRDRVKARFKPQERRRFWERALQGPIAELVFSGRDAEARPHFARAWELLSKDQSPFRADQTRLERLRRLGGG